MKTMTDVFAVNIGNLNFGFGFGHGHECKG